MRNFLARRLLFAALSMIVASMAVFGLAHAKEDPINLFIQPGYFMAPETLAALKAKWGLDKPLVLQYLTWAGNMLRGDLGDSVQQQRPVTKIVGEKWGGHRATCNCRLDIRNDYRGSPGNHFGAKTGDRD